MYSVILKCLFKINVLLLRVYHIMLKESKDGKYSRSRKNVNQLFPPCLRLLICWECDQDWFVVRHYWWNITLSIGHIWSIRSKYRFYCLTSCKNETILKVHVKLQYFRFIFEFDLREKLFRWWRISGGGGVVKTESEPINTHLNLGTLLNVFYQL